VGPRRALGGSSAARTGVRGGSVATSVSRSGVPSQDTLPFPTLWSLYNKCSMCSQTFRDDAKTLVRLHMFVPTSSSSIIQPTSSLSTYSIVNHQHHRRPPTSSSSTKPALSASSHSSSLSLSVIINLTVIAIHQHHSSSKIHTHFGSSGTNSDEVTFVVLGRRRRRPLWFAAGHAVASGALARAGVACADRRLPGRPSSHGHACGYPCPGSPCRVPCSSAGARYSAASLTWAACLLSVSSSGRPRAGSRGAYGDGRSARTGPCLGFGGIRVRWRCARGRGPVQTQHVPKHTADNDLGHLHGSVDEYRGRVACS